MIIHNPAGASSVFIQGQAAHDAAATANPVTIAGVGQSADPSLVTAGDVVRLLADLLGKQVVLPYALKGNLLYGVSGSFTLATGTTLIAAQGAGISTVILEWTAINRDSADNTFVLLDGATQMSRLYVKANSSVSLIFPGGLVGSANTAVNVTTSTNAAIGDFLTNGSGYKTTA